MNKLPVGVQNGIFRFLSHPAADAIRERVLEFQAFSRPYGPSDMHTFYIYFFLERKMMALPKVIDEIHEQFGDNVGIDSDYFRPSLWRLYENNFPGYFSQRYFVDTKRATFRPNPSFCVQI